MWRILLSGAAVCILGTSLAWAQIERNTESRTKPDSTGEVSERDSLELPAELAPPLALQMSIAGRAAAMELALDCQATALYLSEQYAGREPALADTPVADTAAAPSGDTEPTELPEPAPEPVTEPSAEPQVPEPPAAEAPEPTTALDEPAAPESATEPPVDEVRVIDQPVADDQATDEPEPAETSDVGVQSLDDLAAAQQRQDRDSDQLAQAELDLPPSDDASTEPPEELSDAQSSEDESALDATSASLLTGALGSEGIEEKPNRRPDLSKHINKDRDADQDPAQPSADELLVDDHQAEPDDHSRRSVGGWRSVPPEREAPPEDPQPAAPSRLNLPSYEPPQEPADPMETPEPVEEPEIIVSPDADVADTTATTAPLPATNSFDFPEGSRVLLDQLLSGQPEDRQVSAVLETAPAPRRLVVAAVVDTSASGLDRLNHRAPVEPVLSPWPPSMPKHDVPSQIREVSRGNSRHKKVALTFDDGPHPEFTSQLLAVLDFYDVPATFFFVGIQAQKYPHWVKMTNQAGHEIGSHTYDHFRLPKLPREEQVYQIDECQRLVEGLTGVTPRFLRPPGGQYDAQVRELAAERGMVLGLWDVALNDTREGKTVEQMLSTAARKVRSGSVVLAHDGIQATVDMLPELIESLRAQGYEFVTMSELASGM
jgi:peptidoglycan/xylan/chitin deacetylase (PgdA/CDA1 family)